MSKDISAIETSVIKNTKVEKKEKIEQKEPTLREMLRFLNVDHNFVWQICLLSVGVAAGILYDCLFLFFPISMAGNFMIGTFKGHYKKKDFSHVSEHIFAPVKLTQEKYSLYLKASYWTNCLALLVASPFLVWCIMCYNSFLIAVASFGVFFVKELVHAIVCLCGYSYAPYFGEDRSNSSKNFIMKEIGVDHTRSGAMSAASGTTVVVYH